MPAPRRRPTQPSTDPAIGPTSEPTATATVIDHIGPDRHPHRVTIIRLARAGETYEIRWRENVRDEDGQVTRERRTAPGGHSKKLAYERAEKVWRNLERTDGYTGAPPRPAKTPLQRRRLTIREVGERWLAQHDGKIGTIEGYEGMLRTNVWTPLTFTTHRGRQSVTRTVHLGSLLAEDTDPADIRAWTQALAQKPDPRRKGETVAVSSATVKANLRVLTACLNWGVRHGHLTTNPAKDVTVTVHGARRPEWFRTAADFWAALAHIDAQNNGALHNALITKAYLGLRLNELAALHRGDVDVARHQVSIRHNFDARHRPSTVKTEESETILPLHPEAEQAIVDELERTGARPGVDGHRLIFRGPRGGILTSSLLADALAYGCQEAGLGYRVTPHGLRHSFANWLKTAGVPTPDIQRTLRHTDPRTTGGYLHTSAEEKRQAIARLPGRPGRGS